MAGLGTKVCEAKSITGTGAVTPTLVLTREGSILGYSVSGAKLSMNTIELRARAGVASYMVRAWIDGDEEGTTSTGAEGFGLYNIGDANTNVAISWTSKGQLAVQRDSANGVEDGIFVIVSALTGAVSGTTYHFEIYEWV